ncbi:MAG: ABC transporter permease [Eubacteriales bacterium]|nr:ABC transporter permease [Eubacteriales bacterium]
MLHLLYYRVLQITRNHQSMFWALAFPLILGTMFRISFGNGMSGEEMELIPAAVVQETEGTVFASYMEEMDGRILELYDFSEEEAEKALETGEIVGIFYGTAKPYLKVAGSGLQESILTMLLDTYQKNAALVEKIVRERPEGLAAAVQSLQDYQEMTETLSMGSEVTDPNIVYYFALIAYACMSGAFLGLQASFDSQANLSPLGARRSVIPTHRLKMILIDLIALLCIHFLNVNLLTAYVHFVLGVAVGSNLGGILLVNLAGSAIGVSLGIAIGSLLRASESVKMGAVIGATLFLSFLAGLMFGNMKDIVEHACPLLNRINPAAVLSDAYYCLGIYDNPARLARCLVILGVMSAGLLALAFFGIRRERYESI